MPLVAVARRSQSAGWQDRRPEILRNLPPQDLTPTRPHQGAGTHATEDPFTRTKSNLPVRPPVTTVLQGGGSQGNVHSSVVTADANRDPATLSRAFLPLSSWFDANPMLLTDVEVKEGTKAAAAAAVPLGAARGSPALPTPQSTTSAAAVTHHQQVAALQRRGANEVNPNAQLERWLDSLRLDTPPLTLQEYQTRRSAALEVIFRRCSDVAADADDEVGVSDGHTGGAPRPPRVGGSPADAERAQLLRDAWDASVELPFRRLHEPFDTPRFFVHLEKVTFAAKAWIEQRIMDAAFFSHKDDAETLAVVGALDALQTYAMLERNKFLLDVIRFCKEVGKHHGGVWPALLQAVADGRAYDGVAGGMPDELKAMWDTVTAQNAPLPSIPPLAALYLALVTTAMRCTEGSPHRPGTAIGSATRGSRTGAEGGLGLNASLLRHTTVFQPQADSRFLPYLSADVKESFVRQGVTAICQRPTAELAQVLSSVGLHELAQTVALAVAQSDANVLSMIDNVRPVLAQFADQEAAIAVFMNIVRLDDRHLARLLPTMLQLPKAAMDALLSVILGEAPPITGDLGNPQMCFLQSPFFQPGAWQAKYELFMLQLVKTYPRFVHVLARWAHGASQTHKAGQGYKQQIGTVETKNILQNAWTAFDAEERGKVDTVMQQVRRTLAYEVPISTSLDALRRASYDIRPLLTQHEEASRSAGSWQLPRSLFASTAELSELAAKGGADGHRHSSFRFLFSIMIHVIPAIAVRHQNWNPNVFPADKLMSFLLSPPSDLLLTAEHANSTVPTSGTTSSSASWGLVQRQLTDSRFLQCGFALYLRLTYVPHAGNSLLKARLRRRIGPIATLPGQTNLEGEVGFAESYDVGEYKTYDWQGWYQRLKDVHLRNVSIRVRLQDLRQLDDRGKPFTDMQTERRLRILASQRVGNQMIKLDSDRFEDTHDNEAFGMGKLQELLSEAKKAQLGKSYWPSVEVKVRRPSGQSRMLYSLLDWQRLEDRSEKVYYQKYKDVKTKSILVTPMDVWLKMAGSTTSVGRTTAAGASQTSSEDGYHAADLFGTLDEDAASTGSKPQGTS